MRSRLACGSSGIGILGATEKTANNDPDWSEGIKLGRDPATKIYYLADWRRLREIASQG